MPRLEDDTTMGNDEMSDGEHIVSESDSAKGDLDLGTRYVYNAMVFKRLALRRCAH